MQWWCGALVRRAGALLVRRAGALLVRWGARAVYEEPSSK